MIRTLAFAGAVGLSVLAMVSSAALSAEQPDLGVRSAPVIEAGGLRFKDLDRNGRLDLYEDWRLAAAVRAQDLVGRMTLAEKAGVMMHGTAPSVGPGAGRGMGSHYDLDRAARMIDGMKVNTFITRLPGDPAVLAEENNRLQAIAEQTRLGIPATISTDPRNHFQFELGVSTDPGAFSKWPEAPGLAAVGDPALVRRFANIARQEYRAVGIQEALSPQADLATEPRWPRVNGTFGEDPDLARRMVEAYVTGFQNGEAGINPGSVVAVAKHWVGYGAARDGWDSHNAYGRYATFPGGAFAQHLIPFEGAFAAKIGGIMPTYSILDGVSVDGKPLEPVAAGYSRQLLTDLLRERFGFQGVILTDWRITSDCKDACLDGEAPGIQPEMDENRFGVPWGVEDLSRVDRFAKAVNAGVDQFGGVTASELLVQAVKEGKVTEQRIDQSVVRIVTQKFQQGLFENPYVDPAAAKATVGNPAFLEAALDAQRWSLVLLENKDGILPLGTGARKAFLYQVDRSVAERYGFTVVDSPDQADIAILRTASPFEQPHANYVFGARQQEGRLDFRDGDPDYEAIKAASVKVPTIVTVYLARPAILTNIRDKAAAILGNFGVSDEALLDVVTGRVKPRGRLPFELPSSMAEVQVQKPDLPHDTAHPLYPIFAGSDD